VSRYHCSCGFAIDDPDEFGDHYRLAFTPEDDIGTDRRVHAELADGHARATGRYPNTVPVRRHVCACGFAADDTPELDDHLLIAFITPDGTGTDGGRHVPMEPSTPDRWYIAGDPR
jgi:uncharacterized protein YndB with AHSA1/START domain